ncbi:MAG: hypothetical protein RL120_12830 [Gammaproteobacteria bacterium]
MKQQINLYLPEFRVKKDPVTVVLMAQVVGGVCALLFLLTSWDVLSRWQLGNQLEQLQASLAEETRRTDELEDQLALRSQNNELSTRLQRSEERLEASRQIRDFLSQTALGNVEGFSEYFKDLSRASMDGLSITEFAFTNGGADAHLVGQVVDSAMVPRYVSNIERGNSPLRSKRFSPSILRPDTSIGFFNFTLSTANERGD